MSWNMTKLDGSTYYVNLFLILHFICLMFSSLIFARHNRNRNSFNVLDFCGRLRVAIGREGEDHKEYLMRLVDLLSSCAEGEGRYVESLCQTLMSVEEIITTLNNRYDSKELLCYHFLHLHFVTISHSFLVPYTAIISGVLLF